MSRGRWLAALAWAALIFAGTSIPGRDLPSAFPHADKLVHLGLYGVLGFLVGRALRAGRTPAARTLVTALGAMALFAAADEWHQQFVPGRSTDAVDWLADLVGATAGLAFVTTPFRTEQRT